MKCCIACTTEINDRATICSGCKSHQSRWRNNATYFSGLTALFALTGSLVTYVYSTVAQVQKDIFWSRQVSIARFDSSVGMTILNSSDNPVYVSHINLTRKVYDGEKTNERVEYLSIKETIRPHEFVKIGTPSKDAFPATLAYEFQVTQHKDTTTVSESHNFRVLANLSDDQMKLVLGRYVGGDSCVKISLHTLDDPFYLASKEGTNYLLPVIQRQGDRLPVIRATGELFFVSAKDGGSYSKPLQLIGIMNLSEHKTCAATGKALDDLEKRRYESG